MRIIKIAVVSVDKRDFEAYSLSLNIHPYTHGWYMVSNKDEAEEKRRCEFFTCTPRATTENAVIASILEKPPISMRKIYI